MAKLTPQDVKDLGWTDSQFGQLANWDSPTGFLVRQIDRAARAVTARIGAAAYAAAAPGSVDEDQIRDAELAFVEAHLWRYRASQFDGSSSASLDDAAYLNRREYLANATAAESRYEGAVMLISTGAETVGSAVSIGTVETGRFPLSSAAG